MDETDETDETQILLMGSSRGSSCARGQAWLAWRAAEWAQRGAFHDVRSERSLSAQALQCVRHERAGHLQC